jgi:hypothetical protein
MRHSSPETKRHYQEGIVERVRQNLEKAKEKVHGKGEVLRFYDVQPGARKDQEITASEQRMEKEKVARPERFELPTLCFEGRCSIQLSYGRVVEVILILKHLPQFQKSNPPISAGSEKRH